MMSSRRDELRDAALEHDVQDVLHHDRRLQHLDLEIKVKRGAAHVSGVTRSTEERGLVRDVIARVRGVLAVWDMIETAENGGLRIVDIGCGGNKQFPDAIGIDQYPQPGVDVVTDLEAGLPLADSSVDHVFAVHVLEHIHNLIPLVNDIHRVLTPDGVLHVLAPHWQHVNAVADPTHVRYISPETFQYFCVPRPGVLTFRPIIVTSTDDTVFADLQPIKRGNVQASAATLTRTFDPY